MSETPAPRPAVAAGRGRRAAGRRKSVTGLLFTMPAVLAVVAIVGYPMVYSLNLSLRSFDLLRPDDPEHYVGLDNYRDLLDSSEFVNALLLTVVFVVVTLTLEIVVGLGIALLINQNMRGMSFFRLIVTLPLMMAPSVAGLQFRFLFADDYGAIDAVLQRIGVTAPLWFVDVTWARLAILLSNLWLATPFVVLVFLAALSNLPKDPFEAARIDGAGSFQILWYILLPMLRPALLIIIVIRMADAFRMFDLVYNLTGGGPGRSTDVLTNFIYRQTFVRADFAGGAAASFVLVILVAVLSFAAFRLLRTREAR